MSILRPMDRLRDFVSDEDRRNEMGLFWLVFRGQPELNYALYSFLDHPGSIGSFPKPSIHSEPTS